MAFIVTVAHSENCRNNFFGRPIPEFEYVQKAHMFSHPRAAERIAAKINQEYPGAGAAVKEIRTQREKELIDLINQITILDAAIATSEWEIADIAIMYFFDDLRIPTDIEGAVKAHGVAKVQDTILSRAYAQEKGRLTHELTKLTRQLTLDGELYENKQTGKCYMLLK